MNLEFNQTVFTAPIAPTKAGKLGKRMTGGVEYDLSAIPANVLRDLLIHAVEEHLRKGLAKLDKDKCTQEEAQAAMRAQLEILKAGATKSTASKTPAGKNPVRDLARQLMKKTFNDASEVKIDQKALSKTITGLFKAHKDYEKTKAPELENAYNFVQRALDTAKSTITQREELSLVAAQLAASVAPAAPATPAKPKAEPKPAKGGKSR